jgi:hypothetical protein
MDYRKRRAEHAPIKIDGVVVDSDWLHHCLVWQLLGIRPQGATEGSVYGPIHHRGQAYCQPRPIY